MRRASHSSAADKMGAQLLAKLDEIMNRNVQKERATPDSFQPLSFFGC